LIAADSIPKPSLNAFAALHKLGDRRIAVQSESAMATHAADGALVEALWNYAPPAGTGPTYTAPSGPMPASKSFELRFEHVKADAAVQIYRVDETHGNVLAAFNAMGRPAGDLTRDQIAALRRAGAMAAPERTSLHGGRLSVVVPPYGLAVVVVEGR
jgi:xylan 1,4-beta-xylosidase